MSDDAATRAVEEVLSAQVAELTKQLNKAEAVMRFADKGFDSESTCNKIDNYFTEKGQRANVHSGINIAADTLITERMLEEKYQRFRAGVMESADPEVYEVEHAILDECDRARASESALIARAEADTAKFAQAVESWKAEERVWRENAEADARRIAELESDVVFIAQKREIKALESELARMRDWIERFRRRVLYHVIGAHPGTCTCASCELLRDWNKYCDEAARQGLAPTSASVTVDAGLQEATQFIHESSTVILDELREILCVPDGENILAFTKAILPELQSLRERFDEVMKIPPVSSERGCRGSEMLKRVRTILTGASGEKAGVCEGAHISQLVPGTAKIIEQMTKDDIEMQKRIALDETRYKATDARP